jgi:LysM repeat protein
VANRGIRGSEISLMPGLAAAPHNDGGAGNGGSSAAYLVLVVLVVLLLATAVVAATTLTGSDTGSGTSQAAEKARKLPVFWKVHTGDSYQSIAAKTGLTVDELETFNPYVNPDTIQPGDRIQLRARIPRGKPKPPGPRFYTVRTGDTFASIAKKTDHSMLHLLEINAKLNPANLQPGRRVRLRK